MVDRLNGLMNLGVLVALLSVGAAMVASFSLPVMFVAFVLFVLVLGWMLS